MSKDNPLVNTNEYYSVTTSASRGYVENQMYSNPPITKEAEIKQAKSLQKQVQKEMQPRN